MSLEIENLARISRNLPQAYAEAADVPMRATRYGDQSVQQIGGPRHAVADEGGYFVATNPTPGTGIQLNANVTAFADTNALFVIQNKDPVNDAASKRIFLDYLKLRLLATAPTATVSMEFALKLDYIPREPTTAANRTVLTSVNVNGDSTRGSSCQVYGYANAGAMTVPAASGAARIVSRTSIPTSLGIAGDEYVLAFGATDQPATQGLTATRATAVARIVGTAPPVVVGPGQNLVVHMWWLTAATTAATFEFELGWWER